MGSVNKDFKVKHGLVVADGGTFGGTVTVATPTDLMHAATKAYVDANAGGGGGNFTVSETPPSSPGEGDAWFDSTTARMYVYFDLAWIEIAGGSATSSGVGAFTSVAVSADIDLLPSTKYFVDTTVARSLTLSATPTLGDEIQIFDASGLAATNNVAVLNNGNKINGVLDSAILDVDAFAAVLVYTGSAYGWRLV